jgi:hypothetical protein
VAWGDKRKSDDPAAPFTINTMLYVSLDAFFDHRESGQLLVQRLHDEVVAPFSASWSDPLVRIENQLTTAKEAT